MTVMKWMQLPLRSGREVDLVRSWWAVRCVVGRGEEGMVWKGMDEREDGVNGRWREGDAYFDVNLRDVADDVAVVVENGEGGDGLVCHELESFD